MGKNESLKSWEGVPSSDLNGEYPSSSASQGQTTKFNPFEQLKSNILDKVKQYEDQQQEQQSKKNLQSLSKARQSSKKR